MTTSCSNTVIRNIMFGFNFVFVITGIIILAVGASVKAYYYPYDTFLDDRYFSLPNMLIATGSLIFFISFLGCYGAMRENWFLLMAFSVLLAIIFIFELSVGIAGYVLRDKTSNYIEKTLQSSMSIYATSPSISNTWDIIQEEFQCCGVQNYADWYTIFNNYSLPLSCCSLSSGFVGAFYCNSYEQHVSTTTQTTPTTLLHKILKRDGNGTKPEPNITTSETTTPETTIPETTTSDITTTVPNISYPPSSTEPHSYGCHLLFTDFVKRHAVDIGAVGISLAVIQLAGIFLASYLARQLKNGYYST